MVEGHCSLVDESWRIARHGNHKQEVQLRSGNNRSAETISCMQPHVRSDRGLIEILGNTDKAGSNGAVAW